MALSEGECNIFEKKHSNEMTKFMLIVFQCSQLFYYKVSSEFLRQESRSSYSFGKIKNVGETELSEFLKKKISASLKKGFIFRFHIYFSASLAFYFIVSDT